MSNRRLLYLVEIIGILLALVWLFPFYLMGVNAFKEKRDIFADTIGLPETWTWDNFVQAFEQLGFLSAFGNSVLITGVSTILIIIFSAMAAYAAPGFSSCLWHPC